MNQLRHQYVRDLYRDLTAVGEEANKRLTALSHVGSQGAAAGPLKHVIEAASIRKNESPKVMVTPPASKHPTLRFVNDPFTTHSTTQGKGATRPLSEPHLSESGRWLSWLLGLGAIAVILLIVVSAPAPKSPPPSKSPATSTLAVTKSLVGNNIDSAGQLTGVGATLSGPKTTVVGYISYTSGKVGSDSIVLTLSGKGIRSSCGPRVISYVTGNLWCKWNEIGAGNYKIEIRVNDRLHKEAPFEVTLR